jgi:hypothetical protein
MRDWVLSNEMLEEYIANSCLALKQFRPKSFPGKISILFTPKAPALSRPCLH